MFWWPICRGKMTEISQRKSNPPLRCLLTFITNSFRSVPVTESSIIIAVSSPRRADAMAATKYCIDRLKARVPIWKKEVFEDGMSDWMENKECAWRAGSGNHVNFSGSGWPRKTANVQKTSRFNCACSHRCGWKAAFALLFFFFARLVAIFTVSRNYEVVALPLFPEQQFKVSLNSSSKFPWTAVARLQLSYVCGGEGCSTTALFVPIW